MHAAVMVPTPGVVESKGSSWDLARKSGCWSVIGRDWSIIQYTSEGYFHAITGSTAEVVRRQHLAVKIC